MLTVTNAHIGVKKSKDIQYAMLKFFEGREVTIEEGIAKIDLDQTDEMFLEQIRLNDSMGSFFTNAVFRLSDNSTFLVIGVKVENSQIVFEIV